MIDRRTFSQLLAMSLAATAAPVLPAWAQGKKRSVVIGHTGITWPGRVGGGRRGGGAPPPPPDPALNETIFKDVSELGFSGLELFDWQINGLESQGLLGGFVEKYKLPLISSYTSINLTDPAQRTDTIAAAVAVGKIMKKYGGKTIVIGPNGRVGGEAYNYNDHKQNIITTLNELGQSHHRHRPDCRAASAHRHRRRDAR